MSNAVSQPKELPSPPSQPNPNQNGHYRRSFTPRHIHIISLGSNIGSGLFIATGKALATGGPGNMLLAYAIITSSVWAVLQTISEMTIAFPVSGSVFDYADRWVDPALAFGAGFAEWLGFVATMGSEGAFFTILVQYWAGHLPQVVPLTIYVLAIVAIFLLPNTAFAWFEYAAAIIKVLLFLLIILVSLAVIAGAGKTGHVHDGSTWTESPAFANGFAGFAQCVLLATWAVGDQVLFGIMGGEAHSPRFSMAHAAKLVPVRTITIYLASATLITLLVPSSDGRLLGGAGVTASPFVIAIRDAGIPVVPDLVNAGMMVGILAIGVESVYISSRVLRTVAHQGLIPGVLARVDAKGRPRYSLIVTGGVGVVLTYLNLSARGIQVLNWFVAITSASFACVWLTMALVSWRFHAALKAQNDPLFSEPYAWKSASWPLGPVHLTATALLVLASCVAVGVKPLDGQQPSASTFFQNTIGLVIVVGFALGYKILCRTTWRDPATADLTTGRRTLTPEEIAQLDRYHRASRWTRFLTYVQLW